MYLQKIVLFAATLAVMERIEVTPDLIEELNAHIERTGIGPYRILKAPMPDGINGQGIKNLLMGRVQSVRADYVEFVRAQWAQAPDGPPRGSLAYKRKSAHPMPHGAPRHGYVKLVPPTLKQLGHYRDIGLLPSQVLKRAKPKGLTTAIISNWVNGTIPHAKEGYLAFVLEECARLENCPSGPIIITPAMRKSLQRYKDKTGLGGVGLLKGRDVPEGLSGSLINKWSGGVVKLVRRDHWDYVVALYKGSKKKSS